MYSFILVIKQGVPFPLLDVALSLSPKNYRLSILSHRSTLDIGPAILCSDAEWLDHEHAQLRDEIVEQNRRMAVMTKITSRLALLISRRRPAARIKRLWRHTVCLKGLTLELDPCVVRLPFGV